MAELSWKDRFWTDWESNRRLTVEVGRAFPAEALWATPVPAMRSFGKLLEEIAGIEHALVAGVAHDRWSAALPELPHADPWPAFAAVREETSRDWAGISVARLAEVTPDPFGWGLPPQSMADRLQYALENEIHHRAQGYVYLRLLGIEPPPFWKRS